MASSFATAQAAVTDLVERFARNLDAYQRAQYKEAEVRHEFIEPFFDALGWDVYNRAGYAEPYKDVVHEESLRVAAGIEAPDYTFRVGGTRKFFVEAKKPAVALKGDAGPAYQLRRYAWSARLPLSILTDFEEFAVYDCTRRPKPGDKAGIGRVTFYTFEQYPDHLRDIWDIFAKEAVLQGSFDRYAEDARKKRGTSAVDEEFLKEIEGWREALAHNLALRNPELSVHELNFAVQAIIDRIIFLRVAEDRGIEEYGRLMALQNGANVYDRLMLLYRQADQKYDAGLFDFRADTLTPQLRLDDKVLKGIFSDLYYPHSPYEFSVIGAEILGQVYEQFLGKVIRLTTAHRAVVEEKPEVKKAGGVYYTPRYIVDYIVQHTVGELVKGKTPKQISQLRVLDPACGSGSFLLGAYEYLLRYHLDWYTENTPEKLASKREPPIYRGPNGEWRLTTAEKKRILLNNIYGVDIDRQAVGVTKLSLLLKVLQGETQETLGQQLRLWRERALPDLGDNIKCGNSLIGPDYWEGKQMALLDEEEIRRVNAFDWEAEFPEIMAAGGFDAVIGNPPYVLLQDEFRDTRQLTYFRTSFAAASYKIDTYHLFIERGIHLLRNGGRCSMITPANFLTNNHLASLRRLMLEKCSIGHILAIDQGVFQGISVDNAIFVMTRNGLGSDMFPLVHAGAEGAQLHEVSKTTISVERALSDQYVLFTGSSEHALNHLWNRIWRNSRPLKEVAYVNFGKQLRNRKEFTEDVIKVESVTQLSEPYRPCYTGRDVTRYHIDWNGLACLDDEVARRGGCWDPERQNAKDKLITRQIGTNPEFALDRNGYQCLNTVFMVVAKGTDADPRLLLGLLNSTLLKAFWLNRFYDHRRTFPKIKGTYLLQLPVYTVHFSDPADVARQNRMVALVERMLELHKRQAAARTAADRELYARQIEATDREIDHLVYELYGLTEEEIAIVEGAVNG
jgi:type I restriction-modification system DNA methylase subunit